MTEPVYLLADSVGPPEEALRLEKFLKKHVKGQDKAIDTVVKYYSYALTIGGIESLDRPIMVLLFLGPSGVGKTEIARALALYFHNSRRAMTKVDSSELQERHQIATLIGSPPGYVGYGNKAMLSPETIKESKQGKVKPVGKDDSDEDPDEDPVRDEIFKEQIMLRVEAKRLDSDWRTDQRLLATLETEMDLILKGLENARDENEAEFFSEALIAASKSAAALKDNTVEIFKKVQKLRQRMEEIVNQYKINELKRRTVKTLSATSYHNPGILLLDEIEKAHPAVHDLLLGIMEDGGVTLGTGAYSDLRNMIIILTSNVGSRQITDMLKQRGHIGFYTEDSKILDKDVFEVARAELNKHFKTEFINRLDSIVAFRHLTEEIFYEILDKEIELFAKVLSDRIINSENLGVYLEVSPEVKRMIVEASRGRPELGARLLRHKFLSMLKMPLGNILYNLRSFSGNVEAVYDTAEKKIAFRLSKVPLLEPIIEPDPEPEAPQK